MSGCRADRGERSWAGLPGADVILHRADSNSAVSTGQRPSAAKLAGLA
jgi:hypothetical protein